MTQTTGALRLNGEDYINPLDPQGSLTRNLALGAVAPARPRSPVGQGMPVANRR